jgi:hypothetical protein
MSENEKVSGAESAFLMMAMGGRNTMEKSGKLSVPKHVWAYAKAAAQAQGVSPSAIITRMLQVGLEELAKGNGPASEHAKRAAINERIDKHLRKEQAHVVTG